MLWYITFGNSCYRGVNSPKRTFNLLAPMVENPNNGLQSCHELRLKISYALGILHSAECFQYEVWSMSIVWFAMSYFPTFSHDVLIWSNQYAEQQEPCPDITDNGNSSQRSSEISKPAISYECSMRKHTTQTRQYDDHPVAARGSVHSSLSLQAERITVSSSFPSPMLCDFKIAGLPKVLQVLR